MQTGNIWLQALSPWHTPLEYFWGNPYCRIQWTGRNSWCKTVWLEFQLGFLPAVGVAQDTDSGISIKPLCIIIWFVYPPVRQLLGRFPHSSDLSHTNNLHHRWRIRKKRTSDPTGLDTKLTGYIPLRWLIKSIKIRTVNMIYEAPGGTLLGLAMGTWQDKIIED